MCALFFEGNVWLFADVCTVVTGADYDVNCWARQGTSGCAYAGHNGFADAKQFRLYEQQSSAKLRCESYSKQLIDGDIPRDRTSRVQHKRARIQRKRAGWKRYESRRKVSSTFVLVRPHRLTPKSHGNSQRKPMVHKSHSLGGPDHAART